MQPLMPPKRDPQPTQNPASCIRALVHDCTQLWVYRGDDQIRSDTGLNNPIPDKQLDILSDGYRIAESSDSNTTNDTRSGCGTTGSRQMASALEVGDDDIAVEIQQFWRQSVVGYDFLGVNCSHGPHGPHGGPFVHGSLYQQTPLHLLYINKVMIHGYTCTSRYQYVVKLAHTVSI